MNSERILTLDISSKTGYTLMVSSDSGIEFEGYGTLTAIHEPKGKYPANYVVWANLVYDEIYKLIKKYNPDCLVIEETVAGSKAVYTQKFLEWVHYLLACYIKESNIKYTYLLTGAWRSEVGAKMTKEESARNKYVKEYKTANSSKFAYDINGKRIGRIGKKHVNVRRANEVFGKFFSKPLRKKDEDLCDSLLLGYCYHLRRLNTSSVKEVTLEDLIEEKD